MEEFGLLLLNRHSNSRLVVSSRNHKVLPEIGVAETSIIRMGDLVEEENWQLFFYSSFSNSMIQLGLTHEVLLRLSTFRESVQPSASSLFLIGIYDYKLFSH